ATAWDFRRRLAPSRSARRSVVQLLADHHPAAPEQQLSEDEPGAETREQQLPGMLFSPGTDPPDRGLREFPARREPALERLRLFAVRRSHRGRRRGRWRLA